MSNANPQYAEIEFSAEDDTATIADELLATIRNGLLEEATSDETGEVVGPAAAAVEIHSRITHTDEPPTHIDPRDAIDNIESLTDQIIRKYTDDLVQSAQRIDDDDREMILDVVAEIDAREGGDL